METVKQRAEKIADIMREHFPHVHVMVAADQTEPKWYRGFELVDPPRHHPNHVDFIASDIPYKRSDYPANLAMRSIPDVLSDGIMESMPSVIADMVADYNRGTARA